VVDPVKTQLSFFHVWGIDIDQLEGLHLAIDGSAGKNAQAMCFILQAPEEVYVLMRPEGGWIDLETLWHELGHGLSAVYTSETLSIAERDLSTSFALSEAYAFLLQNIVFSKPFLTARLSLSAAQSERMAERKRLKDLYIFRRYAAKFLAEYEMFQSGDIADGTRYAELMHRYTGFAHLPESHLFDLVPEFYSLDYVWALVAEAAFTERFIETYGPEWMFHPDIGETLKALWRQGNRYSLTEFMVRNGFGGPAPESWSAKRRRGIDPVGSGDDSP
jgi:oligoendopeptidase F